MSRSTHVERHSGQRIGWLRAAVLGANDGIVSIASLSSGLLRQIQAGAQVLAAQQPAPEPPGARGPDGMGGMMEMQERMDSLDAREPLHMVITLTLNPAVDQTVHVDRLAIGDVNRCRDPHLDPAGKGINVARMVHRLGWPTIAFGFLAGEFGLVVRKALDQEGCNTTSSGCQARRVSTLQS